MAKPRKILEKQETKGLGKTYYGCPWCFRFVARKRGLQQCAKCGGMVDNDNTEPWPPKTRMKFDGKESWR